MKQEVEVEPLTKMSSGKLLERRPEVGAQIAEVLGLDLEALKSRVNGGDHNEPGYVKPEVVVYLIRHFRKIGEKATVESLTTTMITRLTRAINRRIQVIAENLRDDCFAEAISNIFTRIIDISTDRDDYAQVSFWPWFNNRVMDTVRRHFKVQEKDARTDSLTRDDEDDDDFDDEDVPEDPDFRPGDMPDKERELLVREALGLLTENERIVFLLRYIWGWKVESKDPGEPTISKRFGKTPKTIRNWLNSAEEKIAKWRDQRGT